MVIIYAVAEAVTPVVNGIGSKVIGVIDTSNGLDGIAATTDIKSVKGLKGNTIATNISHSNYILAESFKIACTCHWKQQACKAYS